MRGFSLVALCILATLTAFAGCSKRKSAKPSLGEIERLPRLETIVLGAPSKLAVVRSYATTVDAMEKADVCAMVKGTLMEVPARLDIGTPVVKGELLLTLHVPDLQADWSHKQALVEQAAKAEALAVQAVTVAAAEIKEAQALQARAEGDAEFRQTQYARVARLALENTVSQQQAEEAKLQVASADAALKAAKAQVSTKQSKWQAAAKDQQLAAAKVQTAQAELARAKVAVDFAEIRAPFDGVITKRWADSGATLKDACVPLLTSMRTNQVRVILDVPERDVPLIRGGPDGSKVELRFPALKEVASSDRVEGTISRLASSLDPVTRTMRAEVHLDNKAGLLRPQMTGAAHVTMLVREGFSVPASALVSAGSKSEIFLVTDLSGDPPQGVVKRLEVQVGIDDGLRVEIRNPAINGRELVILKGAGVLRPGDRVIAVSPGSAD